MKKARLIAGMTAAIPAAVGGFAAPAAAHATTTLAHQAPAKGKTVVRHGMQVATTGPRWAPLSYGETLYFRNGGSHYLPAGWSVFVACYYKGNTGNPDPYWDHISAYRLLGITSVQAVGHIADRHVNLNGLPPNVGIPKC